MSLTFGCTPSSLPARLAVKPGRLRQMLGCSGFQSRRDPYRQRLNHVAQSLATKVDSPRLAYSWLTHTPELIPIPILLVTPSFAPWVDTASTFLEQWINRLYLGRDSHEHVHAFVAVIDKIPGSPLESNLAIENNGVSELEGISVLFSTAGDIQGKAAAPRGVRAANAQEAALLFSVRTGVPNIPNGSLRRPTHEVGLRLSNTIFLNGKENTLFGTRWSYNASSSKYSLDQTIELSRCIVTSTTESIRRIIDLPLHPIGKRRRVVSSMGNILRQITKHVDDNSTEPMPASSELEEELPRYVAEHEIPGQKVSVWALIESPEINEANRTSNALSDIIQSGGKLHHVMSGGGGWGKKQGLLSLDPETGFMDLADDGDLLTSDELFSSTAPTSVPDMPPSLDNPMLMGELSSLSQVVRPGDYIQFYVSITSDYESASQAEVLTPQGSASYHFGVVSDTESRAVQTAAGTEHKYLAFAPNHFGALSEKAITYLQPVNPARSEEVLETGTKLNIPGSRVTLMLE
ncbi:hypothetical protein EYZ11_008733 [Aspergillus tanneri]|uniref:Uncharacterized protein n=1 Tax=Aspergillus tanneri TaxID=1220188 RepID=A0A4S3JF65_9EURO|nr:hypothetical protein EYZ11_008733 [Aspergillus tanneri]